MERTAEEFVHKLPDGRWFVGDFVKIDGEGHEVFLVEPYRSDQGVEDRRYRPRLSSRSKIKWATLWPRFVRWNGEFPRGSYQSRRPRNICRSVFKRYGVGARPASCPTWDQVASCESISPRFRLGARKKFAA